MRALQPRFTGAPRESKAWACDLSAVPWPSGVRFELLRGCAVRPAAACQGACMHVRTMHGTADGIGRLAGAARQIVQGPLGKRVRIREHSVRGDAGLPWAGGAASAAGGEAHVGVHQGAQPAGTAACVPLTHPNLLCGCCKRVCCMMIARPQRCPPPAAGAACASPTESGRCSAPAPPWKNAPGPPRQAENHRGRQAADALQPAPHNVQHEHAAVEALLHCGCVCVWVCGWGAAGALAGVRARRRRRTFRSLPLPGPSFTGCSAAATGGIIGTPTLHARLRVMCCAVSRGAAHGSRGASVCAGCAASGHWRWRRRAGCVMAACRRPAC